MGPTPRRRLVVVEDAGAAGAADEILFALGGEETLECREVCLADPSSPLPTVGDDDLVVVVASTTNERQKSVLEFMRAQPIAVPTLAIVPANAEGELLSLASDAMDDFMVAPIRPTELRERVARLLKPGRADVDSARQRLVQEMAVTQLVGSDPVFLRAVEHIPRYARSALSVLITGETGTGKELCARAIHQLGSRGSQPFIAVDCGAIPDALFESEFFGHVRGAFTDAHRDHRGLVAMAQGGTLFLDEVDALSLAAQAKVLRFLQERTFRSVGADRFSRADVKVIAATNRDLDLCLRERRFRQDLYFRLNVLRVQLPPLRERRADIELLARHFLREVRDLCADAPAGFSPAALRVLAMHDWSGNVRELSNVVQRAAVACEGARILPVHLDLGGPGSPSPSDAPGEGLRRERARCVAAFERRYIEELLSKHHGNVTHAAREARQERRAFGRLIKKHRIPRSAS